MSILTEITLLTGRLSTEFNLFNTKIGLLNDLDTTDKTNLVTAINELNTKFNSINTVELISDTLVSSTTKTWSITKIKHELSTILPSVLGDVTTDYNDLGKIESAILSLQNTLSTKIDYSINQSLTEAEKVIARTNISSASKSEYDALELMVTNLINELGDTDHDFVNDFDTELNS